MSPYDAISFDTTGYVRQDDRDGARVWHTPDGDGLGLFHYPTPPEIEAALDSIHDVRAYHRRMIESAGCGVIEIEVVAIDECKAIRTLVKAPQELSGCTYIGALTFPFRDFSVMLKVAAEELGTTGIRDSVVSMQLMDTDEVAVSPGGGMIGWHDDPYDRSLEGVMTRNKSETRKYDAQFPDHPLSRARRVLDHLEATLRLSAEIKAQPGFFYRPAEKPKRPWWKLW